MQAQQLGYLTYLYGLIDRPEDALRTMGQLEELAGDYRVPAVFLTLGYLGVGDHERALEQLRAAAEETAAATEEAFLIARNIYRDPVLDLPEFVAVRETIRFRD